MELEEENGALIFKQVGEDLETIFKKAKQFKPKHRLTAAQMDKLNDELFR